MNRRQGFKNSSKGYFVKKSSSETRREPGSSWIEGRYRKEEMLEYGGGISHQHRRAKGQWEAKRGVRKVRKVENLTAQGIFIFCGVGGRSPGRSDTKISTYVSDLEHLGN